MSTAVLVRVRPGRHSRAFVHDRAQGGLRIACRTCHGQLLTLVNRAPDRDVLDLRGIAGDRVVIQYGEIGQLARGLCQRCLTTVSL